MPLDRLRNRDFGGPAFQGGLLIEGDDPGDITPEARAVCQLGVL